MDLFDPKPELTKQHGKPHPDKLEVHFHTQQGKLLASPFKFAKRGQVRHRAVGAAAAHRRDRRRHHAGAVDDDRLRRPRGGAADDPLGQDLRRPAGLGVVGALRPRARSGRSCRPTSSSPTPAGCRWTGRTTGRRASCPRSTRGRRSAPTGTPVAHLATPADVPAAGAPQPARPAQRTERRPPAPAPGQRRTRSPARPLRTGRQDADGRARRARPLEGDRGDEEALRHRQPEVGGVRQALPAGPPAGRARRAVRADLPERPAVGHAQQERREPEGPVRHDRPAQRRAGART